MGLIIGLALFFFVVFIRFLLRQYWDRSVIRCPKCRSRNTQYRPIPVQIGQPVNIFPIECRCKICKYIWNDERFEMVCDNGYDVLMMGMNPENPRIIPRQD